MTIDAAKLVAGTSSSLVLESYDTANYPYSAHKTDTIVIYVKEYARSETIPSYFVILKGSTKTFNVNDVTSTTTLPSYITIFLEQTSALSFVTISNGETAAFVTINAAS